tara:strand:- start:409 stop:759 length:351 start_codon:yes stop_codon:yes gene_type:complete
VARIDKGTEVIARRFLLLALLALINRLFVQRLQTTQSIARENEDLGEDTLQTLYQQRAQLEEGVQKVESIGDNMVVARTTLGDIARRAVTGIYLAHSFVILPLFSLRNVHISKWAS